MTLIDDIKKAAQACRHPHATLPEIAAYLEGLASRLQKRQTVLTRELVDILFPTHGRTSCSDNDPNNGYVNYENGSARCHRCMALLNIGEPLATFKIESSICTPPNPEQVRKRALDKLTDLEKRTLGL